MADLVALWETLQDLLSLAGINLKVTPEINLFVVMFGGMFTLSALIMLLIAFIQTMKILSARSWPTTEGVVLNSEIVSSYSSDSGTSYRAEVIYQYPVGERMYSNNLIAFGSRNMYGGYNGAARTAQKYAAGTPVRVHYKPGNPESAVLEVRSPVGCMLLGMGTLFLCIGVVGGLAGAFVM